MGLKSRFLKAKNRIVEEAFCELFKHADRA